MMARILGIALAIMITIGANGCAQTQKVPEQIFSLKIKVEHLADEDAWIVEFRTSLPVTNLIFDRQINRFRSANWKSLTPGIVIQETSGKERITRTDSKEFQEVSFKFTSYYEMTPKDYEFFQAFSDSSLVMYTGHFNACSDQHECNQPVEFSFVPRSNVHGILTGRIFHSPTSWRDQTHRGTYVYFGNLKPIESKFLTAILDPVMPAWMKSRFHTLLPGLFDYYAKRTGHPLTFKPFIFLNYSPEGEGNSSHGGTLPGLIQLAISGKGWAEPGVESFISLVRFLAHESAHVWNGQLFPYTSGDVFFDTYLTFLLLQENSGALVGTTVKTRT